MKANRVLIGERIFEYKIGNTFVGVREIVPKRSLGKYKEETGVSFVEPYSDVWLDRTRVRELIIERLKNSANC